MLPKVEMRRAVLFMALIALTSAHFPSYCPQCEEEIWEEVPCEQLPSTPISTTTTTTTLPPPTIPPTTTIPPTIPTTTLPPPVVTVPPIVTLPPIITTTPLPPIITLPPVTTALPINITAQPNAFKKCYCECKVGCREFCRKVIINNDQKQEITKVSQTSQDLPKGRIEVKHIHQRKFVPNYGPSYAVKPAYGYSNPPVAPPVVEPLPGDCSLEDDKIYEPPKPAYNPAPPQSYTGITSYYPNAVVDSTSYSIDELTKLLQLDNYGEQPLLPNSLSPYYSPLTAKYDVLTAPAHAPPPPPPPAPAPLPLSPTSPNQYAPVYSRIPRNKPQYAPSYAKASASSATSDGAAASVAPEGAKSVKYGSKGEKKNKSKNYIKATVAPYTQPTVPPPRANPVYDISVDKVLQNYANANPQAQYHRPSYSFAI